MRFRQQRRSAIAIDSATTRATYPGQTLQLHQGTQSRARRCDVRPEFVPAWPRCRAGSLPEFLARTVRGWPTEAARPEQRVCSRERSEEHTSELQSHVNL